MGIVFRKATLVAIVNLQRLENTVLVHIAESFQSKYLNWISLYLCWFLRKVGYYPVRVWIVWKIQVGVLLQNNTAPPLLTRKLLELIGCGLFFTVKL